MATLAQLRQDLLACIENPKAADTMMADSAIIAYQNMLRVQGWIGNLCLVVERELFGQAPLNQYHGHTVGEQLNKEITRLAEIMMPLLERSHRMMAKSLAHLEARPGKTITAAVMVGQAGQVNRRLLGRAWPRPNGWPGSTLRGRFRQRQGARAGVDCVSATQPRRRPTPRSPTSALPRTSQPRR